MSGFTKRHATNLVGMLNVGVCEMLGTFRDRKSYSGPIEVFNEARDLGLIECATNLIGKRGTVWVMATKGKKVAAVLAGVER